MPPTISFNPIEQTLITLAGGAQTGAAPGQPPRTAHWEARRFDPRAHYEFLALSWSGTQDDELALSARDDAAKAAASLQTARAQGARVRSRDCQGGAQGPPCGAHTL
jgi:hypothetical protein